MKKNTIFLLVAGFMLFSITSFDKQEKLARDIIASRFESRLQAYRSSLVLLKHTACDMRNNKASADRLRNHYLQVRAAFKSWEYLAEYLEPVFMKDNINGAPLPKLERNTFGVNVWEPRGMQVLDELIYSEQVFEERELVISEIDRLLRNLSEVATPRVIYDRYVLEAARQGLVRIFTLSLTGFDVPASKNALADAVCVMRSMQDDMRLYCAMVDKVNSPLAERIDSNFSYAIRNLAGSRSFEKLDRLLLLTQYINPLFADILQVQEALHIEMAHEVIASYMLPPFNHRADNIFANDFLDASRFLNIPASLYSDQLIALGRNLFFDPLLSATNERSCGSCHNPGKAFTDGLPKSLAMGGAGTLERNAPTLINAVYSERFFSDMRAETLEDQIEHVVVSEKEFNTGIFAIISRLSQSEEYNSMFTSCFALVPGNKITRQTISFAISAYVGSLRGFNAPFDKYVRGEIEDIHPSVKRGFNLFMGKAACGTCHFAPVFNGTVPPLYTESESEVLGVPENPDAKKPVLDADAGRGKARLKEIVPFYLYSFKTPTVRNIALTAPYMHNGSYKTLDDVMGFYNKGGGKGLGIHLEHQTLPFDQLNLSKKEIKDIIAFMNALTDTCGMTAVPEHLPGFAPVHAEWNTRRPGGIY